MLTEGDSIIASVFSIKPPQFKSSASSFIFYSLILNFDLFIAVIICIDNKV